MTDSDSSSEQHKNQPIVQSDDDLNLKLTDSDGSDLDLGLTDSDESDLDLGSTDSSDNVDKQAGSSNEENKEIEKEENDSKNIRKKKNNEDKPKVAKEQKENKEKTNKDTGHFFEGKKDIMKKYEELKGKQLFIRFPKKLPEKPKEVEEYVKKFNERIINVRRPRQKSTRHCMVDFDNEKDKAKAMKELSKVEVDGTKLIVQLPKTEDHEYLEKLATYQAKKREKFLEFQKARKLAKSSKKNFTSTIHVSNIPSSATAADIKALFPEAVELRFTVAKGIENTSQATVTLPSSKDASEAKRKKHNISGNVLVIKYATQIKSGKNKKKNKKVGKGEQNKKDDSIKLSKDSGNKGKNQKRKLVENKIEVSPKKKKSNEVSKNPNQKQQNKKVNPNIGMTKKANNNFKGNKKINKVQKKGNIKNKSKNFVRNPLANGIKNNNLKKKKIANAN